MNTTLSEQASHVYILQEIGRVKQSCDVYGVSNDFIHFFMITSPDNG